MALEGRPIGVIRVYESADTPHIMVRSGAVFVRETAGVHDAANPRKAGGGAAADRKYAAIKVGSRQQLVELAERGTHARQRADDLLTSSAARDTLIAPLLGIGYNGSPQNLHAQDPFGKVIVRLAPLTLPSRFRGWCTSHEAASSVLHATETLGQTPGLSPDFVTPHHCGASAAVQPGRSPYHHDVSNLALSFEARTVIDNAGAAGATLRLAGPDEPHRRTRFNAQHIASALIAPVLDAAATILQAGAFFGRARCQIDLADLPEAISTDPPTSGEAAGWIPLPTEITLPLSAHQRDSIANLAARAYVRSAGVREWDRTEESSA